ncbi:MAG: 4Fe-4S binding protein [Clostridiales bacterium]|nr:4Fe-4S binding protein [Clostridiales bacterium]
MHNSIVKIYFSPTGNTKASVDAIASSIGTDHRDYDVTVDAETAPCVLAAEDFAVIGAPVYGGRIPKLAAARLSRFRGTRTPCIIAVTYGNRHYDDALLELSDLAQAQGFVVRGAAALVGRHTYGAIQTGRPDSSDLAADGEFARKAAQSKESAEIQIAGNRPYRDGGNGGSFRPLTTDACISCGLCAASCPAHAIETDNKTIRDNCISCFRCIRHCPVGAKNMDTERYLTFAAEFSQRLKSRRENEYFL